MSGITRVQTLIDAAEKKLDTAEFTARRADLYGQEANQAIESAVAAVVNLCRAVMLVGSGQSESFVRDLSQPDILRGASSILDRAKIAAPEFEDLLDLLTQRGQSITATRPATSGQVLAVVAIGWDIKSALEELAEL